MFHRVVSLVLCLLVSMMPCWCEPPQAVQAAGQISALIPSAERNSKPAKAKEEVDWNDLLKTEHTGRLRTVLTDGSTISMGSDSEMRVLQHDAKSQQTSIQMGIGAMRSRVVKLTQPGAKFEVHTPQAVIGVIGTYFAVLVTAHRTRVVCFEGSVSVTPTGGAPVTCVAGSMVDVEDNAAPVVTPTPRSVLDDTLTATDVEPPGHGGSGPTHTLRNVIIGIGVSGALTGIVLGTTHKGSGCPAGTVPGNGGCVPPDR
jgi:hypothetical protein